MITENSIFYQIYPIGFCGAPKESDGIYVNRICKVKEWLEHIKNLGADTILFNPLFESDAHGYDTRDMQQVDCRLGNNIDFKEVCNSIKENNLNIVLDGVFNHVGRGFWAFKDVLEKRENSPYRYWFNIDFNGNTCYNDGFYYEAWEGCFNLVKLNLRNPEVVNYIIESVELWINEFNIDGIRLDVAYCLDRDFLRHLRNYINQNHPNVVLIGEVLHGDYNLIVNNEMLHSCTNYECYKGIYSSFNSMNMFEISYSLNRQFGPENWCIYRGKHLLNFVDNHDVTRIASILKNERHLPLVYALLFTMPGLPSIYYGSEWGVKGNKNNGDYELRPSFENPIENELTNFIHKLSEIHKNNEALFNGGYRNVKVMNTAFIFEREVDNEKIWVCINANDNSITFDVNEYYDKAVNLLNNEIICINNKITLEAYDVKILKISK